MEGVVVVGGLGTLQQPPTLPSPVGREEKEEMEDGMEEQHEPSFSSPSPSGLGPHAQPPDLDEH